jgi:hypothetical protein
MSGSISVTFLGMSILKTIFITVVNWTDAATAPGKPLAKRGRECAMMSE